MFGTIVRTLEGRNHRNQRIKTLSTLSAQSSKMVKEYVAEMETDEQLLPFMKEQLKKYSTYNPSKHDFNYTRQGGSVFFPCVTLYSFMRLIKPKIVVETGGTPGKSSASILAAFERNGVGKLYTCDLPPQQVEGTIEKNTIHAARPAEVISCWIIPPQLRTRHELILGDTKETLPTLLEKLSTIDIFIHDSLHTYDHMMFEFYATWPFIKKGGFMLSDDIFTHPAFQDFAQEVGAKMYYIGNYGVIRK